ncbi:MAG TPA: glycosyltransferase family 39 protein, partial [Candidatus Binatia bacterium]|nr:glycosyltransferase family 39 protein [Candidatus Binatia bacterium]
ILLRLCFVWQFPYLESGDTPVYEELARNWRSHGTYGLTIDGHLVPADLRTPGYPAFLAAVHWLLGPSATGVMLVQAAADTLTCFVIAAIGALVAPERARPRVAVAALWLSALCPFTANYTATVLTEALAVSLTAIALLLLAADEARFFAAGFVTGLGTLVRPDAVLVLVAVALVFGRRWWRPRDWRRLARAGTLTAAGLLLPLAPWAARNWVTLHKVQLLATRYAEAPGEYAPRGFYAWTFTWLWRVSDLERVPWKLDAEAIQIDDVPSAAFDSPAERERIAELLRRYNRTTTMTPAVDSGFAEIARERTARNRLRTYVTIPLLRASSIWFTPRVDILPVSGSLWPIRAEWEDDPPGYCVTVLFTLLGFAYVAMAAAGAWIARGRLSAAILGTFVVVRTVFLATFALTPEPRYVLECFPALLALGAQLWVFPDRQFSSTNRVSPPDEAVRRAGGLAESA